MSFRLARRGDDAMVGNTAPDWNFEGKEFEELLKELEGYLVAGAKDGSPDLSGLRDEIKFVACWYYVEKFLPEELKRINLHEVGEPLARVIDILKNDANDGLIFDALARSPERHTIDQAVERRNSLLRDLEKIRTAASKAASPSKRAPHRPARIDLRLLVGDLANYWLLTTGAEFTQDWQKGNPLTLSAQFVYAIVEFIDPKSRPALPGVTEWVVAERRKGKVMGWFGDVGRRAATSEKSHKRKK